MLTTPHIPNVHITRSTWTLPPQTPDLIRFSLDTQVLLELMRIPLMLFRLRKPRSLILVYPVLLILRMLTQLDEALVFADVDAQSRGGRPRDVAVQDPQPRVVGPERHGHVAFRRH